MAAPKETPTTTDLTAANTHYATSIFPTTGRDSLPLPPAKKYAVVTCMDARLNPSDPASLGIQPGDAHIIRNAGGSARDASRSLLISQHLLGTEEVLVIKHTGCGMLTFGEADIRGIIEERQGKQGLEALGGLEFGPFGDLEAAVREDVKFLEGHAALKEKAKISGWVWEVETGKVRRVI